MEKIKKYIKEGDYLRAREIITQELEKSFDFINKEARDKYLKLQDYIKELDSQSKSQEGKKIKVADFLMPITNSSIAIIGYLLNSDKSSSYKIPKRISENDLLKQKFKELVDIANTKNPEYLELLYILAYTIDETNRLILILGETGVGKSYLAEKIHYLSKRKNKPFKTIDCGNISENLLESELFGHIKGAYTGATANRDGALKSAEGGTLFIDEIHRASKKTRDKLLNYFIHKTYSPMGTDKKVDSDVRIIMGTNKDIDELYNNGEIENDFYFRIKDRVFEIPPLRKRKEDIPDIVTRELINYNKIYDREIVIDKSATDILTKYNWPGNYHQLKRYLLDVFDYCDMYCIEALDREIIENKPPANKFVNGGNPIIELEDTLFRVILNWNPDNGKIITDLIEPMLANIYINKMDGKRTKASRYIEISDKTLDMRLDQYKTIYEKYIKS